VLPNFFFAENALLQGAYLDLTVAGDENEAWVVSSSSQEKEQRICIRCSWFFSRTANLH
jgi:hypothetical protein